MDIKNRALQRFAKYNEQNNSDRKREFLEGLCSFLVQSEVRIRFHAVDTAACAWREQGEYHEILIREEQVDVDVPQLSDASDEVVDLLAREGLLYHEIGHVLYTDYSAWERVLSDRSLSERSAAKNLLNIMEDNVIEQLLTVNEGVGKQLAVKNEMKWQMFPMDEDELTDCNPLDVAFRAAQDRGRYNSGLIDRHLDDAEAFEITLADLFADTGLTPEKIIRMTTEALYDCSALSDAQARYERVMTLFDDIHPDTPPADMSSDIQEAMSNAEPPQSDSEKSSFMTQTPDLEPDGESDDQSGESGDDDAGQGEDGEQDGEGGSGGDADQDGEDGQSDGGEQSGEGQGDGEAEEDSDGDGDAESDADSESGSGGGEGSGAGSDEIPGHEGHEIVIRD